jgi:hypothetical protein
MKKIKIIVFLLLGLTAGFGWTGCNKATASAKNSSANSTSTPDARNAMKATNEPVTLKIKWETGRKYRVQMECMQSWDNTGKTGASAGSRITMGLTHEYAVSVVKEQPGGGRELELELASQKMFYQMGEVPVLNFDSAQKSAEDARNPVAPILRKMVGARVQCFTDGEGRVTKIDGFKELYDRMAGGQRQIRGMIQEMYNETNLKQVFNFAAAVQPDGPVSIGDAWPIHLEMPDPVGLMVMDLNCTFKNMEPQAGRPCARLEFQGGITSKSADNQPASAIKIQDGNVSGRAWFDPDMGMLVNSETEQHMTVQTVAAGRPMTTRFNLSLNFRFLREAN